MFQPLPITIRPEQSKDYDAIRRIILDAFVNHAYSDQTEHLLVQKLREANAITLALVAELKASIVGYIAFSAVKINDQDMGWFGLAPIAVKPELQKKGIGKALISEGLKQLRQRGANGCVLVGEPEYYHRFGFKNYPSLQYDGVEEKYFMAIPFMNEIPSGKVSYHSAFSLVSKSNSKNIPT